LESQDIFKSSTTQTWLSVFSLLYGMGHYYAPIEKPLNLLIQRPVKKNLKHAIAYVRRCLWK